MGLAHCFSALHSVVKLKLIFLVSVLLFALYPGQVPAFFCKSVNILKAFPPLPPTSFLTQKPI